MNRESLRYAPSLIVGGAALLGIYWSVQLALHVRELVLVILLGVVLGVVLDPIATYLTRFRIPRAASVLLVYGVILAALAGFIWFAAPSIVREVEPMVDQIRTLEEDYATWAEDSGLPEWEQLEEWGRTVARNLAPSVAEQALATGGIIVYLFTILVIAVFFSSTQPSTYALLMTLLAPRHREKAAEMLSTMSKRLRGYALAEIISMTLIGLIIYISLSIVGMPFALILGVVAFITELLPIVGPWIGYVPALAIAATEGWQMVIIVSGIYLAVQQLESNVILPIVQRQRTELPALIVLTAILIGGTLLGLLGALAALPIAIIIDVAIRNLLIPWRQRQTLAEENGLEAEQEAEAISIEQG